MKNLHDQEFLEDDYEDFEPLENVEKLHILCAMQ